MKTQCSIALLESALAGNLPVGDETALHQHLEECEQCGAALERMAGGPAWCQEAAALLASDELDATGPGLGTNVAGQLSGGDEWSEADFTVEHLEPADEPGVLGRLGDYDVLEIIGRGGMGVVLKGFDRELKRCIAIKVLSPQLAQSSLARKRFAREAQAAAAVVHANVLAIHRVQPSGRLPYLVMPLVAGESLAQRLTAQGRLELKEILRVGMQAAAGLAAAHEQGLVHRDVKPANILLEKGVERAVLTDFGLARAADDVTLTRWGVIAGTPQYMSPEQARGEPLDGRSDLFSLGCVLYEMATGVSPFRTDTVMATMRRLVDDTPQAMASLNPELPPWFIAIVDRLLEKDPARRFSSAKEVSELLESCLAHLQQPTNVRLPSALPPTLPAALPNRAIQPLARRRRTMWAAAVALLVLGGVGGAWAVIITIKKGEQETKVNVPNGSDVNIAENGDVHVKLPSANLPPATPAARPFGVWIDGKTAAGNASERGTIKSFDLTAKSITKDGVSVDQNAWRIEAKGNRTVRLFEIPTPGVDDCCVVYQAKLKTENLQGHAYLEMWCRFPSGEYFSRDLQNPVSGTTDWASYETPFFLKKGERPDLIKLNLVIDGNGLKNVEANGTIWIKDVKLSKAPIPPSESGLDTGDLAFPITMPKQDVATVVIKAVKTISTCAEGDPRVTEAMGTLRGLKEGEVVTQLANFLDTQVADVRRAAIYILWKGKFPSIKPAVPGLLRLCEHQEDLTRGMAALALGGNRVPSSLTPLMKMASDDKSGYARRCAAIALGFLGDPAAIETLEKAIKDPDVLVRANATAALAMLRKKTTFPLRFKLASAMADDLGQILLGRSGNEATPSANNREITVTAPPDVMIRVRTFITVMDWSDGVTRGSNFEYPRDSVLHAARSFFYACAIEDSEEAFSKLLSLNVLAELKGDTKSEHYLNYNMGGVPDREWEKSLRADWPGKKEAIQRMLREWNRHPLIRITEDNGVAIGFGVKHFCSVSFDGAPKDFYTITIEPGRTERRPGKDAFFFSSLPPWWNFDKKSESSSSTDPDRAVLEVKLKQAKAEAGRQELLYKAGVVPASEFQAAKGEVEILEAGRTGDPVQVAKARLAVAKRQYELASSSFQAGALPESDYVKLKGNVAIAEAELQEAEAKAARSKATVDAAIKWLATDGKKVATKGTTPEQARTSLFQLRFVLDSPSDQTEPMDLVETSRGATHKETLYVQKKVLLDQTALKSADVYEQTDSFGVDITFTNAGKKRFAEITRENIGRRLAIIIGGQLYSAPKIMTAITGGQAKISGHFSEQEARALAAKISDGVPAFPQKRR